MNRARHHRQAIQWARYANHYAHIPMVGIGQWPPYRALIYGEGWPWRSVRRQSKHRRARA